MASIGIKLADGSFYPVIKEGQAGKKTLELTTATDNQTKVQLDLYRSETDSMEDAEYVDTIEVKEMIPHPNGETTLRMSIILDEDENLSAELDDIETGNNSATKVSIPKVRAAASEKKENAFAFEKDATLELPPEDKNPSENEEDPFAATIADDFADPEELSTSSLSDTDLVSFDDSLSNLEEDAPSEISEKSEDDVSSENDDLLSAGLASAGIAAGAAVLASKTQDEENLLESESISSDKVEEEKDMIGSAPNSEDFNFDDENTEEAVKKDDINDDFDFSSSENPEENLSENSDLTANAEEKTEDISIENTDTDDNLPENDTEEKVISEDDFSAAEDTVAEDKSSAESEEPSAEDDFTAETEIPEYEEPSVNAEDQSLENENSDTSDLDLDLPDFNEENNSSSTDADQVTSDDVFNIDDLDTFNTDNTENDFSSENKAEDDFTIPETDETSSSLSDDDFTIPETDDSTFSSPEETGSEKTSAVGLSGIFDDIESDPDFKIEEDDQKINDDLDSFSSSDPTYNPQNDIGFDDLYDKETMEGKSFSEYNEDEEDVKKRTRTPVIICIICAIICIIGACLVLFVLPSKFNLLKKAEKNKAEEQKIEEVLPAENTEESILPPAEETEEVEEISSEEKEDVKPALEDEIVLAESPEEIIPEVPEPVPEKAEIIEYKIKWGDTLWDISDAYYKNPWKYKKIARDNKIKNPDLIISGTKIKIYPE